MTRTAPVLFWTAALFSLFFSVPRCNTPRVASRYHDESRICPLVQAWGILGGSGLTDIQIPWCNVNRGWITPFGCFFCVFFSNFQGHPNLQMITVWSGTPSNITNIPLSPRATYVDNPWWASGCRCPPAVLPCSFALERLFLYCYKSDSGPAGCLEV